MRGLLPRRNIGLSSTTFLNRNFSARSNPAVVRGKGQKKNAWNTLREPKLPQNISNCTLSWSHLKIVQTKTFFIMLYISHISVTWTGSRIIFHWVRCIPVNSWVSVIVDANLLPSNFKGGHEWSKDETVQTAITESFASFIFHIWMLLSGDFFHKVSYKLIEMWRPLLQDPFSISDRGPCITVSITEIKSHWTLTL